MAMIRTQILLTAAQVSWLKGRAESSGLGLSEIHRRILDKHIEQAAPQVGSAENRQHIEQAAPQVGSAEKQNAADTGKATSHDA